MLLAIVHPTPPATASFYHNIHLLLVAWENLCSFSFCSSDIHKMSILKVHASGSVLLFVIVQKNKQLLTFCGLLFTAITNRWCFRKSCTVRERQGNAKEKLCSSNIAMMMTKIQIQWSNDDRVCISFQEAAASSSGISAFVLYLLNSQTVNLVNKLIFNFKSKFSFDMIQFTFHF